VPQRVDLVHVGIGEPGMIPDSGRGDLVRAMPEHDLEIVAGHEEPALDLQIELEAELVAIKIG
jgi:hypothetical protein